ncbi:hypothetical protein HBB16_20110 [Pseudonocardia sp. MCCB 268]|nr:hypothetical protein [Pseudonocardia cytotoxica]
MKLRGDFLTCRAAIPIADNGERRRRRRQLLVDVGRTRRSVLTAPNYVASNSGVIR